MVERPSADHCRDGGRGGGLRRKKSGGRSSYRRVEAPVCEIVGEISTTATQGERSSHRSVQVVDDATDGALPPAPFQSSLRASLNSSIQRGKQHSVMKKHLQGNSNGKRRTLLVSPPSSQTGAGEIKQFVSSIAQSMEHKDECTSRQVKNERRGREMQSFKPCPSVSREPFQRLNSRKPADYQKHPHRSRSRESRLRFTKDQGSYRSSNGLKARLTRKHSTDSVSSQRSDCSNISSHSNKEYRSKVYDGPYTLYKVSCNQGPLKSSIAGPLTESTPNVCAHKERPGSRTIGSLIGRRPQDPSRRSSLDGGAGALRRIDSISSVKPSDASNAQAPRKADALDLQLPAPSLGSLMENSPTRDSILPKSEQFFAAQEEKDTFAMPVIDEKERERLEITLQVPVEARKLECDGSLTPIMTNPFSRKDSIENEARRHSPLCRLTKNVKEKGFEECSADKNARFQEYYAKLDNENTEQRATRRAVPFKSSLKSSIKPIPATFQSSIAASIDAALPRTVKSLEDTQHARRQKLAAALPPSRATVVRAKKLQYSLTELRRLMVFAIPRPADLLDMKITEVFDVRNPNLGTRRSFGRLGVGEGVGFGQSIGGSFRKGDRLGGHRRRDQVVVSDRRRDKQGGRAGRGGSRGGRGGNGRTGFGRSLPLPLYDGPIEPLTVSENRWKPSKEKNGSSFEKTLSNVKCILNKLTREKFVKLTNELCAVNINSFVLLSSIVSIIMDKALEEPSFADVYADLCKEFHMRTVKQMWSFLSVLSDENGFFYWTGIDKATFTAFAGPFDSPHSCLEDVNAFASVASTTSDWEFISSIKYRRHGDCLIAVGEKEAGAYYYSKRNISEIGDEEPFGGPFKSVELAQLAAGAQTTFTRLLVNRCQGEFEKTNKHIGSHEAAKERELMDPRRRETLAMRAKAKMLGNIRFIGELYKVDLVKQSGVQGCILYLLGLELLTGRDGQEVQAQTVRFPDEQDLEALCKMLATAGKKIDQPNTQTIMKIIILRMVELSNDLKLPSRARFLVKDILETRDHMWEPRRKEMQQKTLEEVRREAHKLQLQGKNAQHDDVQRRRQKTRLSSAQLAKQSSNLIVAKKEEPEHDEKPDLPPAQMLIRIKSIIQEYLTIMDLNEAIACVEDLPVERYRIDFAEQVINTALESKTHDRELAVELLVGLYERGTLDKSSIQTALVNVMAFLEDMKIDIPLIHQYSALILGRLITTSCFGLAWVISEALTHCVECKLTSLIFPEVLSVLELEADEETIIRMLSDEKITPESVLPIAMRNEVSVKSYLHEHGIEYYFTDETDELNEEASGKMRSALKEYLSVKDLNEVVLCIEELEAGPDRWRHFVHIMLVFGMEVKQSLRRDVTELLVQLSAVGKINPEDIEAAVKIILCDYDDLRVDIPQLAVNLSELWTPLFAKKTLSVQWLGKVCCHLVERGRAADIFDALLSTFESLNGLEALVSWWKIQADTDAIWAQLSPMSDGITIDERLAKWKSVLQL